MFNVDNNPTFTRTVTVHVPDGKTTKPETLIATLRALPSDVVDKFGLNTAEGTTAFLKAVIVRLDDLAGRDGKPVDYSEPLRDRILQMPYVRVALARTYFDEVAGAVAGN